MKQCGGRPGTGLQQPAAQATGTYQNLVATSLFGGGGGGGGEGAMGPSMLCARALHRSREGTPSSSPPKIDIP